MKTRTLLITGAGGVLGWHLTNYFRQKGYSVTGTFAHNKPSLSTVQFAALDLNDNSSVRNVVSRVNPDLVIHSAAMTRPDECEQVRERAYRVNVEGTEAIAEHLDPASLLVYISTDLVFNGEKGNYREQDSPDPINYYGETKLMAEKIVHLRRNSVVCRLAKLYAGGSPFHPCFVTWMCDRFERAEVVPLFSDQFRTPIYVGDTARALETIFSEGIKKKLYHLGGPRRMTRLEFGRALARIFDYDESLIQPTRLSEVEMAPRGRDCSLDSSLFREDYDFHPVHLEVGLQMLLQEMD